MAVNPYNVGWNQVNKKVTKATRKVIKTADEYFIPKTPVDIAFTLMGGKVINTGAKLAYKGAKKVVKGTSKTKKVTKVTKKK